MCLLGYGILKNGHFFAVVPLVFIGIRQRFVRRRFVGQLFVAATTADIKRPQVEQLLVAIQNKNRFENARRYTKILTCYLPREW